MKILSTIGRIFFGLAIAGLGLQTIYYRDFPYMLLPPKHSEVPGFSIIVIISGLLLFLAGACIIVKKWIRPASLLLGAVLLLIFLLLFVPYQFMSAARYMHLAEWENAEKELALAGGALVIAALFSGDKEASFFRVLGRVAPLGGILFAVPMICFGILHFMFTKEASTLVPAWMPGPIFWTYMGGVGLIGGGLSIILKIKVELFAAMMGIMIFLWVVMLHIPRIAASPPAYLNGEVASTFIALAYSGTPLVIAGMGRKRVRG